MKVLVIKSEMMLRPETMTRISESLKRDFQNGKPITLGPGLSYEVVEADDLVFVSNREETPAL